MQKLSASGVPLTLSLPGVTTPSEYCTTTGNHEAEVLDAAEQFSQNLKAVVTQNSHSILESTLSLLMTCIRYH